jgi:hypothetical protein
MNRHGFRRFVIWMFIGLLGVSSMSLAEEGTWRKRAEMPTPRAGLSTCVVNGKIYAIGGANDRQLLSTVEEYDPGLAVDAKGKLAAMWGEIKAAD